LDDNQPPSKEAITFFGLLAGKANGSSVSAGLADMAGSGSSRNLAKQQILATYQYLNLYPTTPRHTTRQRRI
jgi:hypothetical protein